jgi:hypothetical protein
MEGLAIGVTAIAQRSQRHEGPECVCTVRAGVNPLRCAQALGDISWPPTQRMRWTRVFDAPTDTLSLPV